MKKIIFKILVLMILVVGAGVVFAQISGVGDDFTLQITPKIPGPNKTVQAKVVSYSFDINRAYITWIVNSTVISQGLGEKRFSFTTGNAGTRSILKVVVVSETGWRSEKSVSFNIADLDLLWEAFTHTPLSYRGKALTSSESLIKVSAIPYFVSGGARISPSRLFYKWELNNKNLSDASGLGRDSLIYKSSRIFSIDSVKVTVSSMNQTITAQKRVMISVNSPKLVLYEEHPLEGPRYNRALQREFNLLSNEISLRAEPFFFSRENLSQLSYNWKMNNSTVKPGKRESFLNLLKPEEGEGLANISLSVRNDSTILQFANTALKIIFGR